MLEVIMFGLVWFLSKKTTKPVFLKKPKSFQTDQFRFDLIILEQKLVQTGFFSLAHFFFRFDSVFSGLNRFFSV